MNMCVQILNGTAFYWKTWDTGDDSYNAQSTVHSLLPELSAISNADLSKVNSFTTDTAKVMRKCHELLDCHPQLHTFGVLCDSHGL